MCISSVPITTRNSSSDEIANVNFVMTSWYTYYEIQTTTFANYCVSVHLT